MWGASNTPYTLLGLAPNVVVFFKNLNWPNSTVQPASASTPTATLANLACSSGVVSHVTGPDTATADQQHSAAAAAATNRERRMVCGGGGDGLEVEKEMLPEGEDYQIFDKHTNK